MKKILATTLLLTSFVLPAEAARPVKDGIVVSADINRIRVRRMDTYVGVITAGLGYKFDLGKNFSLIPEYRIGTGFTEGTMDVGGELTAGTGSGYLVYREDIDVEVDSFMAFSVRGQYDLNNGIYAYIAPSYSRTKTSTSTAFLSTDPRKNSFGKTYTGFGYRAGLGFHLTSRLGADVSYERYSEITGLSFGLHYTF